MYIEMINQKKKVKPCTGQLFAAPISDGSVGLTQVAFAEKLGRASHTVALAFFPIRASTFSQLTEKINGVSLERPFAIVSPSSTPIEDGDLQLLGTADVAYENVDVKSRLKGPYLWFDGKEEPWGYIFDMYYGLYPWDALFKKHWMDELLLEGYQRPETAKLKKDFSPEELESLGVRN